MGPLKKVILAIKLKAELSDQVRRLTTPVDLPSLLSST